MALVSRHFGASPDATRIQLDRMGLLPAALKGCSPSSGRQWAYRYGWGTQFDSAQEASSRQRVPRRILDRATEAYRQGKLGISALAKLQGRPVPEIEQALVEAGVTVKPAVRRADISTLTARAQARKSIEAQAGHDHRCRNLRRG
jgi:hypothetical protein